MPALLRWRVRPAAVWETLLIIGGLAANLFLLDHRARHDGAVRFEALSELLTTGHLPEQSRYPMLGPLFATPLWFLGKVVETSEWWINRYNVFVLGAGMLAIYLLLRDRVDRGLLRRFFLLLVLGSMFSNHLLFFYGEVFTSVVVAVGVVAIVVGRRVAGWVTLVLGVVNTPATIAGLVTLTADKVLRTRRVRYGLAVVAAGVLILAFNWIQRGDILATGYEGDHGPETVMPFSGSPGMSNPLFFGLISLIFAFGKGLLFFAPGLFLPVRRTLAGEDGAETDALAVYRLWFAFLVGVVLVYAVWWSWHGGWFWGPRFLLFASVIASFVLAVRLTNPHPLLLVNVATVVALCLSVWVGVNGGVYGDDALYDPCVGNFEYETPLCYYTPEFSPLWYPFVEPWTLDTERVLYLTYSVFVGVYLLVPFLATTVRQFVSAGRAAGWLTWRYRW